MRYSLASDWMETIDGTGSKWATVPRQLAVAVKKIINSFLAKKKEEMGFKILFRIAHISRADGLR